MPLTLHTQAARDPIRVFVETLMFKAGLDRLSPAAHADCLASLMSEAQRRIGLEVMRAMDERTAGDFEMLVRREATDDEMAAFFRVRVPGYETAIRKALADFGDECLTAARETESAGKGI